MGRLRLKLDATSKVRHTLLSLQAFRPTEVRKGACVNKFMLGHIMTDKLQNHKTFNISIMCRAYRCSDMMTCSNSMMNLVVLVRYLIPTIFIDT